MKAKIINLFLIGAMVLAVGVPTAFAAVTDAEVAAVIEGGQAWLKNTQQADGHWDDSNYSSDDVASTGFAVAALLETGVAWDNPTVMAGVHWITETAMFSAPDKYYWGSSSHRIYNQGAALIALSLWATQADPLPISVTQMIRGGRDYMEDSQFIDASDNESGSWNYNGNPGYGGDTSNSQFGVMGLWYANQFLGDPTATTAWAAAAYSLSTNIFQPSTGTFSYQSYSSFDPGSPMTGAGMWILAMIGYNTDPMVADAINWFADPGVYTWANTAGSYYGGSTTAYYYGLFGMVKALTATAGAGNKIGITPNEREWDKDFAEEMVNNKAIWGMAPANPADPTPVHWGDGYRSLDGGDVLSTSWVLMSMSFIDPNVEKTHVLLPDPPDADYPVRGLLTLSTTGGVTINRASRRRIGPTFLKTTVTLPVGAVNFTLNLVNPGDCTELTIKVPPGALDPNNHPSFVQADGTLKPNLNWFKIENGEWKGQAGIPMVVDQQAGVIRVTLCDGGPGDEGPAGDGKIVDPGAPGFTAGAPAPAPAPVNPTYETDDGTGCFMDNIIK